MPTFLVRMAAAPSEPWLIADGPLDGDAVAVRTKADGLGRRIVALRTCKRGEVMLKAVPLFMWGPDARATAVELGGAAYDAAGQALGSWDALAGLAALRRLPAAVRQAVLQLGGGDCAAASKALDKALGVEAVEEAVGGAEGVMEYAEVAGILATNATANSDGRRALYSTLSMVNHSCAPNAAWRTADAATGLKELVCIARSLPAGDEVCITYLAERDLFTLGYAGRRQRLRERRGFDCLCERCCAAGEGGESEGERELAQLAASLLDGAALRTMPSNRESAVQQCKDLGRQLRRLDVLWPPSSALKASLWNAFVELLASCGAPPALMQGAAQRALEESRPCVGDGAWTEQARGLEQTLRRCGAAPAPNGDAAEGPPLQAAPPAPARPAEGGQ